MNRKISKMSGSLSFEFCEEVVDGSNVVSTESNRKILYVYAGDEKSVSEVVDVLLIKRKKLAEFRNPAVDDSARRSII